MMDPRGWRQEGRDLLRGTAGGLIFGAPLLYTMEVWQRGEALSPGRTLIVLIVILLFNGAFSLFSGLREENEASHSPTHAFSDAISAFGLALVLSGVIMVLIGRVNFTNLTTTGIGMILIEALVISVGITFTNIRFGSEGRGDEDPDAKPQTALETGAPTLENAQKQVKADMLEAAATLGGAFVFSMSVAPTEEILKIALGLSASQQLLLLGAEVLICYLILYASNLGQLEVHIQGSLFQSPTAETVMTVGAALLISICLLLLFGFPGTMASPSVFIASVVTLALPAVVGGAAGRLAV
jgi:putative integral membrane protein (TIGR02587 family)